jgi:UDP-2-acetamido-2-deoxy-ribo-hexuluronate aminotransferase
MIPFIDLKTQYKRIENDVDAAIKRVLEHGRYILGPEVGELECQLAGFAGTKYCIGCSSGTDALLMSLMAYGAGPGDAIFTTPFTFFATAETIALTGATTVFVDIDPDTYNLNPEKLSEAIKATIAEGKLTPKGIIPVDLFGLSADYDKIMPIAEEHGLFVIQDACQGLGAEYNGKVAPSMGHVGATSFYPAKPLGGYGDSGAVFTDDEKLHELMRSILVHGQSSDKYNNVRIGLNARMDTIQAAILLEKLKLFPEEIALRQQVAKTYGELLDGVVKTPYIPENSKSVWAQYSVQSERRTEIQAALQANDIPCACFYPIPLHLQTAFANLGYAKGDMPVSESVASKIFSLPMHPYLDTESIKIIADVIANA